VSFVVVPEVESPDCSQQQQESPSNEHRDAGLHKAAGGGWLHRHGGVGLYGKASELEKNSVGLTAS